MSRVEFSWDPDEFQDAVAATEADQAVLISVDEIPDRAARILEAGAGSGRVMKFLADREYVNVVGLELNAPAVAAFNSRFPDSQMVQGDLLDMPFDEGSFDAVVSYGVVEHFEDDGLGPPLSAIFRVLRPGGTAIVTVPSVNALRRIGDLRHRLSEILHGRSPSLRRGRFGYAIHPRSGPFFEYRLTTAQFEAACRAAGFEIVRSQPIYHIDGLYHALGGRIIRYERWQFVLPPWLRTVNGVVARYLPTLNNHMHLCVLRKPAPRGEDGD
jgi:SAM-dependent methyltransferase